ncbi:hypothetical protein GGR50DRAFT_695964 [Xylaria sp. CBS 124048]|nr:hypothetical protein GGR50DRAFT_695964 [Xylaria sp. CBS 124048]
MPAKDLKRARGTRLGTPNMFPRYAWAISPPMPSALKKEPVLHASSPMPRGYKFVPKGNPYVTRHCRQQTLEAHQLVFMIINDKKQPIGIRVPSSIYAKVMRAESATRVERQSNVRRRDDITDKRFGEAILAKYPRVPRETVPAIIRRATAKHKGRVGRTGKLDLAEKVRLAVQAHIRHNETDYDKLLKSGMNRTEARALTFQKVVDKLKEWGPMVRVREKLASPTVAARKRRAEAAVAASLEIPLHLQDVVKAPPAKRQKSTI